MTLFAHRDRGRILYEQGRYEQAIWEFQSALAHDPDDTYAKYLQAYALHQLDRSSEALALSHELIANDPEDPYYYELEAWCLLNLNRISEALKAAQEAIELDPTVSNFWYCQGAIERSSHDLLAALISAETGLSIDPDDTDCLTLQAQCLTQLGRTDEVPTALLASLHQQPNDASIHALAGMAMLETGDHQQARQYFADALRLDPSLTVAEAGMADAIKSKNIVYRLFLRYLFWLDRQSDLVRKISVLGGVFVAYFIAAIGHNLHIPFLGGLGLTLFTVVVLSLFIEPTFNVVLAFDKTGQYLIQPRSVDFTAVFRFSC